MNYKEDNEKRLRKLLVPVTEAEYMYFQKYKELVGAPSMAKAIRDAVWTQLCLNRRD